MKYIEPNMEFTHTIQSRKIADYLTQQGAQRLAERDFEKAQIEKEIDAPNPAARAAIDYLVQQGANRLAAEYHDRIKMRHKC